MACIRINGRCPSEGESEGYRESRRESKKESEIKGPGVVYRDGGTRHTRSYMQMYALALRTSSSVVSFTVASLMYAHFRDE